MVLAAIRNFARQEVCARDSGDHVSAIVARGELQKFSVKAERLGVGGQALKAEIQGRQMGLRHMCKVKKG